MSWFDILATVFGYIHWRRFGPWALRILPIRSSWCLSNMAEITSILDTDLYKLTMQQAVMRKFPTAIAKVRFTNRSTEMLFTKECIEIYRKAVAKLSGLQLTVEEREWLSQNCPYLESDYLDYLQSYRFKPEQVIITFIPTDEDPEKGQIDMEANGPWLEIILWEIPLMALLSEIYFMTVDKTWKNEDQEERAYRKGKDLLDVGAIFSEFGTRRRRSYKVQDDVVVGLIRADKEGSAHSQDGKLLGTSNVHLARKYGLMPIGTIAHEWFMATAAIYGYEGVNTKAMDLWETVYHMEAGSALYISLTDTFSTDVFIRELKQRPDLVKRWRLRQDSGDPIAFVQKAKQMYDEMGVDPKEKPVVFSDSLNVDKAIKIKAACDAAGMKAGFGIGTFLSNDFRKIDGSGPSRALNMVIKLASINDIPCVKISDDLEKNTGQVQEVRRVKEMLGIPSKVVNSRG